MQPHHGSVRRIRRLAPVFLALLAAGCSSNSDSILGPRGDTGGKHLVVFATDRGGTAGQFHLALYDLDARAFRRTNNLTFTSRPVSKPSLSSNGLYITFQCDTSGTGNDDIYIYRRSYADLLATPRLNTDSSETEPVFTGDILKMMFVRRWNGHRHIRIYDPALDSVLVPGGIDTAAVYDDWSPSPDRTGARFAFVSNRNGNPDIFIDDSGTLRSIPELQSAGNDIEPSLTPDGRWLCFASDRSGGVGLYDLYLYDLNTSTLVTLSPTVNTTFNERRPSIGAGGTVISFQSDRSTGLGLWDVWNYERSSGRVGQGDGQSSTADDVEPSLYWP